MINDDFEGLDLDLGDIEDEGDKDKDKDIKKDESNLAESNNPPDSKDIVKDIIDASMSKKLEEGIKKLSDDESFSKVDDINIGKKLEIDKDDTDNIDIDFDIDDFDIDNFDIEDKSEENVSDDIYKDSPNNNTTDLNYNEDLNSGIKIDIDDFDDEDDDDKKIKDNYLADIKSEMLLLLHAKKYNKVDSLIEDMGEVGRVSNSDLNVGRGFLSDKEIINISSFIKSNINTIGQNLINNDNKEVSITNEFDNQVNNNFRDVLFKKAYDVMSRNKKGLDKTSFKAIFNGLYSKIVDNYRNFTVSKFDEIRNMENREGEVLVESVSPIVKDIKSVESNPINLIDALNYRPVNTTRTVNQRKITNYEETWEVVCPDCGEVINLAENPFKVYRTNRTSNIELRGILPITNVLIEKGVFKSNEEVISLIDKINNVKENSNKDRDKPDVLIIPKAVYCDKCHKNLLFSSQIVSSLKHGIYLESGYDRVENTVESIGVNSKVIKDILSKDDIDDIFSFTIYDIDNVSVDEDLITSDKVLQDIKNSYDDYKSKEDSYNILAKSKEKGYFNNVLSLYSLSTTKYVNEELMKVGIDEVLTYLADTNIFKTLDYCKSKRDFNKAREFDCFKWLKYADYVLDKVDADDNSLSRVYNYYEFDKFSKKLQETISLTPKSFIINDDDKDNIVVDLTFVSKIYSNIEKVMSVSKGQYDNYKNKYDSVRKKLLGNINLLKYKKVTFKSYNVNKYIADKVIEVLGNSNEVYKYIYNLVNNTIKFSELDNLTKIPLFNNKKLVSKELFKSYSGVKVGYDLSNKEVTVGKAIEGYYNNMDKTEDFIKFVEDLEKVYNEFKYNNYVKFNIRYNEVISKYQELFSCGNRLGNNLSVLIFMFGLYDDMNVIRNYKPDLTVTIEEELTELFENANMDKKSIDDFIESNKDNLIDLSIKQYEERDYSGDIEEFINSGIEYIKTSNTKLIQKPMEGKFIDIIEISSALRNFILFKNLLSSINYSYKDTKAFDRFINACMAINLIDIINSLCDVESNYLLSKVFGVKINVIASKISNNAELFSSSLYDRFYSMELLDDRETIMAKSIPFNSELLSISIGEQELTDLIIMGRNSVTNKDYAKTLGSEAFIGVGIDTVIPWYDLEPAEALQLLEDEIKDFN